MFDTNSRDNLKKSMRVAAYGHIVSGGNVMRSGYAELVSHFSTIIHNTDGWEYAGVYVDQGFGQTELKRLMADGRAGKIDLVIVPNVSVLRKEALLDLVRQLQNLNIDLFFEDENIHTMSEDGEALISVLASFIKPKPEPKPKLLPYGMEDEEEAKVVKRIFQMLMAGRGRKPIAETLNAEGVPSPRDVKWAVCDIRRITKEAAYRDNIIDADTFDAAQDVMSERSKAYHYRDPFEGMFAGIITCGVCGRSFSRRDRGTSTLWLCRNYIKRGPTGCSSKGIRERLLKEIVSSTLGEGGLEDVDRVDNITVYPDGRLIITVDDEEIEKTWR